MRRLQGARVPCASGHGVGALIFDFDGVIGDSEAMANTVWRKL
jgi:hypothetical protein